ncbi:hypothetical protein GGR53DRAFT_469566 [Hypoxylon sp. FL1150]|nr:hypothetical protein GGR53DRAFT_469566 [Hypoxylon sp. FL1150]
MALGGSLQETEIYIVVLAPNHLCGLIYRLFSKSKMQDLCSPQPDDSLQSKRHTPPSFKVLIYGRKPSAKPAKDFQHFTFRLKNEIDVGNQTDFEPIVVTEKPEAGESQDSASALEWFRKHFRNIMPFATTEDHIIGVDESKKARENGGLTNSKEGPISGSKEMPLPLPSETQAELSLNKSNSESETAKADVTKAAKKKSDDIQGRVGRTRTFENVDLDAVVLPPVPFFRENPPRSPSRHRPKPPPQDHHKYHELGLYSYGYEFGAAREYSHFQTS